MHDQDDYAIYQEIVLPLHKRLYWLQKQSSQKMMKEEDRVLLNMAP
jgi:hypothetical protein